MHISFTLSTLPMLLLAAFLWHRAKGQFLPVAMFMSIFAAASVVNLEVGGLQIGVQPTYILLLCALATRFFGRRPTNNGRWLPLTSTTLVLSLFVTYAAVSAFAGPFLFSGIPISNPKLGSDVPLHWELGHLNQLFYLLLSFAMYLIAAYWTAPAEITKSLNWFVGGAVVAALIGVYQFVAMKTGLPFPSDFLYTNNYIVYDAYEINGFPRVNSTFSEASAEAFSLTVALALVLWRLLSSAISQRNIIYGSIIGIGLLITLSSTGYLCLIYLVALAVWRFLFYGENHPNSRLAKTVLGIPFLLILYAILAVPAARESFVTLTHTVILDKTETSSYRDRTRTNDNALKTAADTYWLGAGWGVCRASSFIPTLLGNAGIPGTCLFWAFCFGLLKPAFRRDKTRLPIHGALLVALGAVLVDLVIAAPEITNPIIWLLFAGSAKLAGVPLPVPRPFRASETIAA